MARGADEDHERFGRLSLGVDPGLDLEPARSIAGHAVEVEEDDLHRRSLDEAGNVWRIKADGSDKPAAIATDEPGLNSLASDGKELFWTRWSEANSDGAVLRAPWGREGKIE